MSEENEVATRIACHILPGRWRGQSLLEISQRNQASTNIHIPSRNNFGSTTMHDKSIQKIGEPPSTTTLSCPSDSHAILKPLT